MKHRELAPTSGGEPMRQADENHTRTPADDDEPDNEEQEEEPQPLEELTSL